MLAALLAFRTRHWLYSQKLGCVSDACKDNIEKY